MRFYLRRIGFYLIAFWAALTLNFIIPRLMPGDPVSAFIDKIAHNGGTITAETEAQVRSMLGVPNENIFLQYIDYLRNIFTGHWGVSSVLYPAEVLDVIKNALPWTVCLIGVTTILSFFVQQFLGITAGWRHGKMFDKVVTPLATMFQSVPFFWLALLLVFLFAQTLHLFPSNGGYDFRTVQAIGWNWTFLSSALYYAILPAITILISSLGIGTVGMRNMMVSTLSEDYITVADAKGLTPRRVKYNYAARNAILPSLSGFGMSLGRVVGGSLIVEQVFNYPGVGNMLFQSVSGNDYGMLQGLFLIITLSMLVANLVVDLLYGFIDPRTRAEN